MKLLKSFILYTLIAGCACLLPIKSFGLSEIEFYVTNNTNSDKCFQCIGPFSRITRRLSVGAGGGMIYFYTAAITPFTPYGRWTCSVYLIDNCSDDGPVSEEDTFSSDIVIPGGSAMVDLSIAEVQGLPVINVNFPGAGAANGEAISVVSSLGDDQVSGNSDKDTFQFKAAEGDQVTIRLGDDPSAGHVGSQATLRLKSGRGLGRFEKEKSGEIPLEITATVPEAGVYEVIVRNSDVPDNLLQSDVPDNLLSFKGGYILSVGSVGNKIESLVPSGNVEN